MPSIISYSCQAERPASEPRRKVIQIAVAGLAVPWALASGTAHAKPIPGDRLVEEDAEGALTPLRVSDLRLGKPLLAFPFDTAKGQVRSDSRLNKLVLMRFTEAEMTAETKARSAGGVVAFSAICTHQGCDVKTWLSKEQALVCFCHSTKFLLLEGGSVASGPAPRALPFLPLSLDGDQLVIAGAFSTPPGGMA
jgi:rieske iron-sulfur protein